MQIFLLSCKQTILEFEIRTFELRKMMRGLTVDSSHLGIMLSNIVNFNQVHDNFIWKNIDDAASMFLYHGCM